MPTNSTPDPAPSQNSSADAALLALIGTLNDSGAHACYCPRSVDGGCTCALKDEFVNEDIKQAIDRYTAQKVREAQYSIVHEILQAGANWENMDEGTRHEAMLKLANLTPPSAESERS